MDAEKDIKDRIRGRVMNIRIAEESVIPVKLLIGFIVGVTSSKEGISDNTVLFWNTGVCGGFTTFSTLSLEAFNLFDNKQYAAGKLWE